MRQRSWEVLTSVCSPSDICRQDKQPHLSGNSPPTSNNLILHHQYFITARPLRRCLVLSAAWSTVARWELTVDDPHHLNHSVCNTWQRSIMNKRQSEIQCLIVLILMRAEGRSAVSFRAMSQSLLFMSRHCTFQLFNIVSPTTRSFLTCALCEVCSGVKWIKSKCEQEKAAENLQNNMFVRGRLSAAGVLPFLCFGDECIKKESRILNWYTFLQNATWWVSNLICVHHKQEDVNYKNTGSILIL